MSMYVRLQPFYLDVRYKRGTSLDKVPGDHLLILRRREGQLAGGVQGQGRHARAVLVQRLLHLPGAHPDHADRVVVAGGQQVGGGAVSGHTGHRALMVGQGPVLHSLLQVKYLALLVTAPANGILGTWRIGQIKHWTYKLDCCRLPVVMQRTGPR